MALAQFWPAAPPTRNRAVLVHSAAGGVGSMLVQMAKTLGCKPVVGVVGALAQNRGLRGVRRRRRRLQGGAERLVGRRRRGVARRLRGDLRRERRRYLCENQSFTAR